MAAAADKLVATITANEEALHSTQLMVYPNPAAGNATFEISLVNSHHLKISISNILGKEVMEVHNGECNGINKNVNLSHLTPGIYTISSFVDGLRIKSTNLTVQ